MARSVSATRKQPDLPLETLLRFLTISPVLSRSQLSFRGGWSKCRARTLVTSHQSPVLKHSDDHNCRHGHNPSDEEKNVQQISQWNIIRIVFHVSPFLSSSTGSLMSSRKPMTGLVLPVHGERAPPPKQSTQLPHRVGPCVGPSHGIQAKGSSRSHFSPNSPNPAGRTSQTR
jgi:hypothetical protein